MSAADVIGSLRVKTSEIDRMSRNNISLGFDDTSAHCELTGLCFQEKKLLLGVLQCCMENIYHF